MAWLLIAAAAIADLTFIQEEGARQRKYGVLNSYMKNKGY